MKIYHTSLNKGQDVHGIWQWMFGSFYQSVPLDQSDLIFVVLFNHPFSLDTDALELVRNSGKPIVVFDYWEENWDKNAYGYPFPELEALEVKVYFKREFWKHTKNNWHPIDFYNFKTWDKIDTFEEFNARPINILMIWGLSNPIRPEIHGNLMGACHKYGWTHISNTAYMKNERSPYAVLFHKPWYDRLPEDEMYQLQSQAKITISLPCSGKKCFRSSEAPLNSVMAILDYNSSILWQAGWDETNCVFFGDSVLDHEDNPDYGRELKWELDRPEALYQKYLNGTKIANNIKPETIWNQHILTKLTGL